MNTGGGRYGVIRILPICWGTPNTSDGRKLPIYLGSTAQELGTAEKFRTRRRGMRASADSNRTGRRAKVTPAETTEDGCVRTRPAGRVGTVAIPLGAEASEVTVRRERRQRELFAEFRSSNSDSKRTRSARRTWRANVGWEMSSTSATSSPVASRGHSKNPEK